MSAGPYGLCGICGKRQCPHQPLAALAVLDQCPGCRSTLAGDETCVTCHGSPDRALIALSRRLLAVARHLLAPAGARRW